MPSKKSNDQLDLAEFLMEIQNKAPRENIGHEKWETSFSRIGIVLIGKHEVLLQHGCAPYYYQIERLAEDGVDRVYLLAKGNLNIHLARHVAKRAIKRGLFALVEEFPPPNLEGKIDASNAKCFSLEKATPVARKGQNPPLKEGNGIRRVT